MNKVRGLKCSICGTEYAPDEVKYACPEDGGNLDVLLHYEFLRDHIRAADILASDEFSMWRYLPLLPVGDPGYEETPLRSVGWTPVYRPQRLMDQLGMENLWIKDESANPTLSFKDRASALLVAKAKEMEVEVIVAASSGNAGAALAGMAAAVGQRTVIFVPKMAPQPKIAQLLIYGAEVILVDGPYDDAFELSLEATKEFGWYNRNTGFNPYTVEGKKTAGFEIWEQVLKTQHLDKPLNVFVSVGDGNIITGIHKGLKDLQELGWLEQMPRLFGVQAEGSAALVHVKKEPVFDPRAIHFEGIQAVQADTVADSISVNLPRDGMRALRAVHETDGEMLAVPDANIIKAIAQLGQVGIFAEPAAATAYAGMLSALHHGNIQPDEPCLVLVTGSGLKDTVTATKAVHAAPVIEPTIEALKEVLQDGA